MKRSKIIVPFLFAVALSYGIWFRHNSQVAEKENGEFRRAIQSGGQRITNRISSSGLKAEKVEFKVTPEQVISFDSDGGYVNVAFSPDSKMLAIGADSIQIYETQNWGFLRTIPGNGEFSFSPDSKLLATPNWEIKYKPGVGIWRLSDGEEVQALNDNSGLTGVTGAWGPIAFSPDGRQILTLGEDPNTTWRPGGGHNTEVDTIRDIALKVWDVSTGKRLKVLSGPSWGAGRGASVAWVSTSTQKAGQFEPRYFVRRDEFCQLPDRTLGVRFNGGHQLIIEDLTTKRLVHRIPSDDKITAAALSPDGSLVVGGGVNTDISSNRPLAKINIYRVADGKLLAKFEGKGGSTRAIAFSRDGKKLVVVGRLKSSSGGIATVYAL